MTAGNADIADEVELGRTLLLQGHLETAQRVLVKLCQAQPECAEAFRTLGMVLSKRGDDRRAQCLLDYASDLDTRPESGVPAHVDDLPSDAETRKNQLRLAPPARAQPVVKAVATPVAVPLPPPPTPPAIEASLAPPPPVLTLPVVPPPSQPTPAKRRRGGALLAFFAGVALVAGGVAVYSYHGSRKPPRPSPRAELDGALAAGTLEALMRGRDVARISLETGESDADSWVRFGLVNAFLVLDYDVDAKKDAERALERAGQGPEQSKERTALAATARALLGLAAGDRATAKQQAESAITALAETPPVYALLASARVRTLAGDGVGAARDLDRAMGIAGEVAPVMVDWAASRLDQGDPVAARRSLLALLEKDAEYSRARLLLAEAERALGESGWTKDLDLACKSDAKISRNVRAFCSVGSALQARLEGDRGGALRKAKAASQSTEDPHALAQISLLMALLGEVDAADEVLGRAAKSADPSVVSLRWADLAIRLGRGEKGDSLPVVEHPAGPERNLVALRAAYARSGSEGLAAVLKTLPPGIADIDPEVRTFAKLEREAALPKAEVTALEKRAERWNPMASYVLGVFALRDKDPKLAARRLEKALGWHGDACAAAALYVDSVGRSGKSVPLNKAQLRALHARNVKCPLPEM